MSWSNTILVWLLSVGQSGSETSNEPSWVVPLAFVAAIVFVAILLAGVYLIFLALRQRKKEEAESPDD